MVVYLRLPNVLFLDGNCICNLDFFLCGISQVQTIINQYIFLLWIFSGSSIERLCDVASSDPTGYAQLDDRGPMVRAARTLLGSVTRVLLLADIVVVKQLLLAKDRVSYFMQS